MLLGLRSLYEGAVTPPVVVPPGGGGGGQTYPFRPLIPPRPVGAEVTLRPARARFRAGKLEAFGGSNITLLPVVGSFSVGIMDATGAATIQTESAKATFQPQAVKASGIDNDPLIATALLDL